MPLSNSARKRPGKTGNSPTDHRLSREDWLAAGLKEFAPNGAQVVRIDALAEKLGVTKGSFYWHFEDREDFVWALLDYWIDISTSQVANDLDESDKSPEDRLLELAEQIVAKKLDQYNMAISALALRDAAVAKAVRKVERFRWNYVESLFREIGFRGPELEMRTRTFVVYYTYEAGLANPTKRTEQLRAVERRHAMLVGKGSKDGHE